MTPEEHGSYLGAKAHECILAKNAAGILEHGGHLQEMPTLTALKESRDECVDQFSYIQQAIDNTEKVVVELRDFLANTRLESYEWQCTIRIINLLTG